MDKVKKMSKLVVLSQLKKYVKLNDEKTMKGTFIKTLEKENSKPINQTTELHLVKLGDKTVLVPIIKKDDLQTNPIDDIVLSKLLSKIKNQNDRDIVKQYITQQNMQEVINIGNIKRKEIEKKGDGDGDEINEDTKQFEDAKKELQKKINALKNLEELNKIIEGEEYKTLLENLKENKLNRTAGALSKTINAARRRLTTNEAIKKEIEAQTKETVAIRTEGVRKKKEKLVEETTKREQKNIDKQKAAEAAKLQREAEKKAKEEAKLQKAAEKKADKEAIKEAKAEAKTNAKEELAAFGGKIGGAAEAKKAAAAKKAEETKKAKAAEAKAKGLAIQKAKKEEAEAEAAEKKAKEAAEKKAKEEENFTMVHKNGRDVPILKKDKKIPEDAKEAEERYGWSLGKYNNWVSLSGQYVKPKKEEQEEEEEEEEEEEKEVKHKGANKYKLEKEGRRLIPILNKGEPHPKNVAEAEEMYGWNKSRYDNWRKYSGQK